jgi:hypothetical protein
VASLVLDIFSLKMSGNDCYDICVLLDSVAKLNDDSGDRPVRLTFISQPIRSAIFINILGDRCSGALPTTQVTSDMTN